jgi:hypothetical protein
MRAVDRVEEALVTLDIGHRRVAVGEWGLSVEAGGWPLDIGLALHGDGSLLRVQAEVCGAGQTDPLDLLHRSRRVPLVFFTATAAGVVWIEGWLPVASVSAGELDRLLGLMVAAVDDVRTHLDADA